MTPREPPCPVKGCQRLKAAEHFLVCPFHWRQVMPATKNKLHVLSQNKTDNGMRDHRALAFRIIGDLARDMEDASCRNSFG